jgi:hypothetical protein
MPEPHVDQHDQHAGHDRPAFGPVGRGFTMRGQVPHGSGGHRTADLSVDVTVTPQGHLTSRYCWEVPLDPAISAHILRYRPNEIRPEWPWVAKQVQMLVAALAPMKRDKVARALTSTAHLAMWCHRHGLPNDPEVWFSADTINAFIGESCSTLSRDSIQEHRTWLRYMRTGLAWAAQGPSGEHGGGSEPGITARPASPYSPRQITRMRNRVESLSGHARDDARTLMALAHGLALRQEEMKVLRGDDVRVLPNGMVVADATHLGRVVVAARAYQEYLADLAGAAGHRRLYRPRRTLSHTIGSWKAYRLYGASPSLSAQRLRTTRIVEMLNQGAGDQQVAELAGLSLERVEIYRQFVSVDPDEVNAGDGVGGRPR